MQTFTNVYFFFKGIIICSLIFQITLTIFATLELSKDCMSALEFIPNTVLLCFGGNSDMGNVYFITNTVASLPYESLQVSGK